MNLGSSSDMESTALKHLPLVIAPALREGKVDGLDVGFVHEFTAHATREAIFVNIDTRLLGQRQVALAVCPPRLCADERDRLPTAGVAAYGRCWFLQKWPWLSS